MCGERRRERTRKTTRKRQRDETEGHKTRIRRRTEHENNIDVEMGGIRYPDKEEDGRKRELEGSMNDRRTDTK
jgi:hypothetical protein